MYTTQYVMLIKTLKWTNCWIRGMNVWLLFSQVCVDNVLKTMKENANKASSILLNAIPQISQMDWTQTMKTLKVSCQHHNDSLHSSTSVQKKVVKEPFVRFLLLFVFSCLSWTEKVFFLLTHRCFSRKFLEQELVLDYEWFMKKILTPRSMCHQWNDDHQQNWLTHHHCAVLHL